MLRVSLLLSLGVLARAEVVTLDEAVRRALERYGAVRVSTERSAEAAQAIALARTAYLPRADFLGQMNRATRNNLFGMVFPQATLPGISGPPLAENSMTNVWGTMVGFTVSWEPFDFGLRKAEVNAAETQKRRAELGVERTRFEVAAATADAYLTLLAAEEMVKSAEAARKRAAALEEV
ncbi:MAG: TolC family protein, partial [Bryobacteraceae bacterium]|nr:TolC family protein [Bryobacteraceae bacterium]